MMFFSILSFDKLWHFNLLICESCGKDEEMEDVGGIVSFQMSNQN